MEIFRYLATLPGEIWSFTQVLKTLGNMSCTELSKLRFRDLLMRNIIFVLIFSYGEQHVLSVYMSSYS